MTIKKYFVGGNWKMNGSIEKIAQISSEFESLQYEFSKLDVIIAPPAIYLSEAVSKFPSSKLQVSSQNVHDKSAGAYTGEISITMLNDIKVPWVIVGHSERRSIFNETDEASAAVNSSIGIIFCFGESLEVREADKTWDFIATQLEFLFDSIDKTWSAQSRSLIMTKLVLAYEPIWAIGTGKVATPEQAQEVHHLIRKLLKEKYGEELARKIRIIYGGSVNAKNCKDLICQQDIDGFLVGGASLTPDFNTIVQITALANTAAHEQ